MQAKQPRSDILYMTTLDTGRCSHIHIRGDNKGDKESERGRKTWKIRVLCLAVHEAGAYMTRTAGCSSAISLEVVTQACKRVMKGMRSDNQYQELTTCRLLGNIIPGLKASSNNSGTRSHPKSEHLKAGWACTHMYGTIACDC